MAAGKINLQKASGGITAITGVDGASNTELVLPESGTVATTADVNNSAVLLKTITTGTATFTATTNNINLTGIGIGVEIGDVIQISGAIDAKNNSEFTVEVITDANNIIVNQAHANKGTTKNVATQAGDAGVTVKLLAKWYNASDTLGRGWVDVSASRLVNTPYPNNTKRAFLIAVDITVAGGAAGSMSIGSNTFLYRGSTGTGVSHTIELPIPSTSTYSIPAVNITVNKWQELR